MGEATGSPRAVLVGHTLHEVLKHQNIVVLRETHTTEIALKKLAIHRILSAPVVQTDGEIAGFVDVRDILSSFLKEIDVEMILSKKMLQRMRLLEEAGIQFSNKPISQLSVQGGDGSFLLQSTAESKVTLLELVHDGFLFPQGTKSMQGGNRSRSLVHRVGLFDKQGRVTHIVSQSDVIRFLAELTPDLGELANMTVEQLGWADKHVISVQPDQPAIEVMALMNKENISAVAVLSGAGRLMGNFSMSDLRTILSEHFGSLSLPVGEFLALEHGVDYWSRADRTEEDVPPENSPALHFAKARDQRKRPPSARNMSPNRRTSSVGAKVGQSLVYAEKDDTLALIFNKLARNRLHRLYVVDDDLHPVGVITLTDVLRKLTDKAQEA